MTGTRRPDVQRHVARGERCVTVELPTLLLLLADYVGWLAITFAYTAGHWRS